ncbi:hypothetical protein [Roseofilum capinflatum]|uniref:Uncharacterized protein n=1 Tax=Roseofilum capinflatum BLCC-M114 TaxID=3022440 RepID=A0ABT7B3V2_9CYAN|nr:hypothetical protein [Roseofilum capinflatum]MDJ1173845.1 hypothetical protein [Roseofilum capinflatum BLCC-M114]
MRPATQTAPLAPGRGRFTQRIGLPALQEWAIAPQEYHDSEYKIDPLLKFK